MDQQAGAKSAGLCYNPETMESPRIGGLALIAVASGLAACGGGGNLPFCQTGTNPYLAPLTMTSPSPGATGVPDNLSAIDLEGFGASQVMLVGGTQNLSLTLTPVVPSTAPDGIPQWIAPISTPLLAATTYTVKYTYTTSGSDCTSQTFTAVQGSFATQ
jgi:hypothetical protein